MIPVRTDSSYHHAYVVHAQGGATEAYNDVVNWVETALGITGAGNPNKIVVFAPTLSIDMVRTIHTQHVDMPFATGTNINRVWIIHVSSIPHESQNALLKILEEPKPNNTFILIVTTIGTLLPTLLSRVVVVSHGKKDGAHDELIALGFTDPQEFMLKKAPQRLMDVAIILKKYEADKITKGDIRNWCELMLSAPTKPGTDYMQALLYVLSHIEERGSSPKILLEYIAIQ